MSLTLGHIGAIEIAIHWRWAPILVLSTFLLGHELVPLRYPAWPLGTVWLVSIAVIAAGEVALLLHELSHALVARHRGLYVERIMFHGLMAETMMPSEQHDALIALAGPGTNLGLALLVQVVRVLTDAEGPFDVLLTVLLVVNLATVLLSLVPIGRSDGNRALRAWRQR